MLNPWAPTVHGEREGPALPCAASPERSGAQRKAEMTRKQKAVAVFRNVVTNRPLQIIGHIALLLWLLWGLTGVRGQSNADNGRRIDKQEDRLEKHIEASRSDTQSLGQRITRIETLMEEARRADERSQERLNQLIVAVMILVVEQLAKLLGWSRERKVQE